MTRLSARPARAGPGVAGRAVSGATFHVHHERRRRSRRRRPWVATPGAVRALVPHRRPPCQPSTVPRPAAWITGTQSFRGQLAGSPAGGCAQPGASAHRRPLGVATGLLGAPQTLGTRFQQRPLPFTVEGQRQAQETRPDLGRPLWPPTCSAAALGACSSSAALTVPVSPPASSGRGGWLPSTGCWPGTPVSPSPLWPAL